MHRDPVSSSNLLSVGYDPRRKLLQIEFQNGNVYEFNGIEEDVWKGMRDSESKGQFFQRNIRPVFTGRLVVEE